jgi:excisionase family DNA binding protein
MMRQFLVGCTGQRLQVLGRFDSQFHNTTCGAGEISMRHVSSDRWLSVDEIAAYLGVKRDTVYKWIDRKKMPAHKVGSLWKFRRDEIDEWVRSGNASDANEPPKPR